MTVREWLKGWGENAREGIIPVKEARKFGVSEEEIEKGRKRLRELAYPKNNTKSKT